MWLRTLTADDRGIRPGCTDVSGSLSVVGGGVGLRDHVRAREPVHEREHDHADGGIGERRNGLGDDEVGASGIVVSDSSRRLGSPSGDEGGIRPVEVVRRERPEHGHRGDVGHGESVEDDRDGRGMTSRRAFLAGAGGAVAAAVGYLGVRVGDMRPYEPALPTGETPRERIVSAASHRFSADHRVVAQARVLRDYRGEKPYLAQRYRGLVEHSRRRETHVYSTFRTPTLDVPPPLPGFLAFANWATGFDTPRTLVAHLTDVDAVTDPRAPTPKDADSPIRFGSNQHHTTFPPRTGVAAFLQPHRARWTERERTERRVTFELTGADEYVQPVRLSRGVREVHDGCWVRVTLDEETGRLRRVHDHRDVTADHGSDLGDRRVVFETDVRFDEYGSVSAPRPPTDLDLSLRERFHLLKEDVEVY